MLVVLIQVHLLVHPETQLENIILVRPMLLLLQRAMEQ
jgi:hypothetical protein